ncbi:DUF3299 domain-containing protein [Rhizobium sp. XQZ8]|uniref:DUF3299 domain-containing protein n=1 Tax=Rhizobium populisoli TaxID=2859785 RepID=UPI001CA5F2F4|nr:DUF3299 domain-containing protein [Rhizobium populisoli]
MSAALGRLKSVAIATAMAFMASGAVAGPQSLQWSALRPADQSNADLPLPGMASSRAQGETMVWRNDAETIALTGFILPIDQDRDLVYEFMLVPWAGACSHSAPPPPNQLVRVVPNEPFRISKVYEVVTITGALKPGMEKTQLFIMDGVRVLDYGYSMSGARVSTGTGVVDPDLRSVSPFGILSRG